MRFPWLLASAAALLQEGARYAFWRLYDKAYSQELLQADASRPRLVSAAVAIGWGFGATELFLSVLAPLSHGTGPGLLSAPACPASSAFHIQALFALPFFALHVLWAFLVVDVLALPASPRMFRLLSVGATHVLTSLAASALMVPGGSCVAAVAVVWLSALASCAWVWRVATLPNSLVTRATRRI